MKSIGVLILMILLLSGCAKRAAPEAAQPLPAPHPPAAEVLASGPRTGGLQRFSLGSDTCRGLISLREGLVIVSSDKNALFLRFLDPAALTLGPRIPVGTDILAPEAGLQAAGNTLSWYNAGAGSILVWDAERETLLSHPVPEEAIGTPLLSPDGKEIFCCTEEDIRALELRSGISRIIKEDPAPEKTLTGLYLDAAVLRFDYLDPQLGTRCCFLRTDTGQLLWEGSADREVVSWEDRFYAAFPNGAVRSYVSGTAESPPRLLLPAEKAELCWFLPGQASAVTLDGGCLSCYSLPEGILMSRLVLPEGCRPLEFAGTGDGSIWFTAAEETAVQLYRWTPEPLPAEDSRCHSILYHSPEDPDLEGLAGCAETARELGERYGIRIIIGKDALSAVPEACKPESELQVHILQEALQNLDRWLGRYPPGYLQALAQRGSELTLCLVRSAARSTGMEDLTVVPGFHFWQDTRAVIVLPIGDGMEGALYHQLYHLADTVVLGRSGAYDSWARLNPGDFTYDYDYAANRQRQSHQFLQEHARSFVDMYAMSFPAEDRARLLEYAMLPGNEALFNAPILQQKLTAICTGLREAFDLETYPTPLPWEQYLHIPLT